MGLDMFTYRTSINLSKSTDFQDEVFMANESNEDTHTKIMYWRKHHELHDWMKNLYYEKGGEAKSFNCVPVELTLEDLSNLEKYLKRDKNATYNQFLKVARNAITEGDKVFYDSWW